MVRGAFALGTIYLASQWWRAHDNNELPMTTGLLVSAVGGLGIWFWTFSQRPTRPTRSAALVTAAMLILMVPALPRLRPMLTEPEYAIESTGKQIEALIHAESRVFGNFAHALTASTRLRAQQLFKVRYGKGQLRESFVELGTTHLLFDCDDKSPIPHVFAGSGLPLEEIDRYYIQGTQIRLFRLRGIDSPRSPFEQSLEALRRGEIDDAEALLTRCLEQHPTSAAAWHQLAGIALRRGNGERAYKCLVEAVVHDPTRVHAHRDAAQLLAQNGHASQALAHLRTALAVTPGDPDLASQVAGIDVSRGKAHADSGGTR